MATLWPPSPRPRLLGGKVGPGRCSTVFLISTENIRPVCGWSVCHIAHSRVHITGGFQVTPYSLQTLWTLIAATPTLRQAIQRCNPPTITFFWLLQQKAHFSAPLEGQQTGQVRRTEWAVIKAKWRQRYVGTAAGWCSVGTINDHTVDS